MPFSLYMLGLAVFAQATSEFMLSGLVPDIARDMDVSLLAAGLLTSAFAVGMIVGAPLAAAAGARLPRRGTLLAFLVVFLLVHVLGAVTTSYAVLVATRVLAALANAGFLALALATATAMVPPDAKGRATAVLLGGTTVACVAGVPAGALLGQLWGWRAAFWAVAAVSGVALAALVRSVPAGTGPASAGVRGELREILGRRVGAVLLLGTLVNGATFCAFTYLAPLVTGAAGLAPGWVPAVLALFGLGAFAGVTVGGRAADTRPRTFLVIGAPVLLLGWVLLASTAGNPVALLGLVLVQGAVSFGVGSLLIAQVLYRASGAPALAGACATAAFNVGAAVGPWLGGAGLEAGLGARSPVWIAAALVGGAGLVGGAAWIAGPRPRRSLHTPLRRA